MPRVTAAAKRTWNSHTCHAKHCKVATPPTNLMCFTHWRMVPKPLKDLVWKHYRSGQEIDKAPSEAYLKAANDAIEAVAEKEKKARAKL